MSQKHLEIGLFPSLKFSILGFDELDSFGTMFSDHIPGVRLDKIVSVALDGRGLVAVLYATLQFGVTVDVVKNFGDESPCHCWPQLLLETYEVGVLFCRPLGISAMWLARRLISLLLKLTILCEFLEESSSS